MVPLVHALVEQEAVDVRRGVVVVSVDGLANLPVALGDVGVNFHVHVLGH